MTCGPTGSLPCRTRHAVRYARANTCAESVSTSSSPDRLRILYFIVDGPRSSPRTFVAEAPTLAGCGERRLSGRASYFAAGASLPTRLACRVNALARRGQLAIATVSILRRMRIHHIAAIAALVILSACASTKPLRSDPNATREQICENVAMRKLASGPAREEAIELARERGYVREDAVDLIRANKVAIGMNTCEVLAAWGTPVGTETYGKKTTYWYRVRGRATNTVRFDAEGRVHSISVP
jgi:outer membrane protein assembly factor BamE (lipoprotein component of BamABCDE complex)